ncbi:hypothetical protein IMY05_016G0052400 [Salix suchowensis]|nr:hypothetical protein IMY05_016G0052400 [Salix suchowensis]
MDLNMRPEGPCCRYYSQRMVRWVNFCCQPGEWIPCYACEVTSLLQTSLCFVVCSTLSMCVWNYILKP